ncbi:MAG: histone deacetylase [Bacteroidetes bacterium]|nr:MAG: histone deacetylase [Bacteroidota bacterium]
MLKIAYDPIYAHPLPAGHRFPMLKYELIPGQLLHEGSIGPANLFAPQPCPASVVLLTHHAEYFQQLSNLALSPQHVRRIGFPLTAALVHRELVIAQGTIDCCGHARLHGVALNVAGGTHHAFANRGEGFCLLNDMAIAANYLLHQGLAQRILVVDLDVHQGNGTAKLFEAEPRVYTFSMHGGHNYPFVKEKSDWDIPLPDGTDDAAYLALLAQALPVMFAAHRPDFVFYLSGVDVLDTDKFGKLKLTLEGCRQRDAMVFEQCQRHGTPCVVSMGGGYSADVKRIVEAHCNTYRTALSVYG